VKFEALKNRTCYI